MKTKVLLGIVVAIVVLGAVGYWYTQRSVPMATAMVGTVTTTGDGWSHYETSVGKWKSFSFSYPPGWILDEKKIAPDIEVLVSGDSYHVRFSDVGKGLPTGVTTTVTTETISGYEVKFYREPGLPGYTATVSVCPDLGGSIVSSVDSREVTDKIIASLKCSE